MLVHWKLFTLCAIAGLVVALGLRAGRTHDPAPAAPPGGGLLVDLGNRTCPVMGNAVDGETYLEWNHLRVGFCCPGCDARFREDPEAALERTGVDWRAARDEVRECLEAPPEHRAHRLAALRARWTIVREPVGD